MNVQTFTLPLTPAHLQPRGLAGRWPTSGAHRYRERKARHSLYLLSPCPRSVPASVPAIRPGPPAARKPAWLLGSRPFRRCADGPCPRVPATVARPQPFGLAAVPANGQPGASVRPPMHREGNPARAPPRAQQKGAGWPLGWMVEPQPSGSAARHRQHLGALPQAVQVVRPSLHHGAAHVGPLGAVVGPPQGIGHAMG